MLKDAIYAMLGIPTPREIDPRKPVPGQPLTAEQRKYLKWSPIQAADGTVLTDPVPHTDTRQNVRKDLAQQAKRARQRRKHADHQREMMEILRMPRKPRAKWEQALLDRPYNKRSKNARKFA